MVAQYLPATGSLRVNPANPQYITDGSGRVIFLTDAPCPEVNWEPRAGYPLRNLNRSDDPTWDPVRRALGHIRYYANRMDLV